MKTISGPTESTIYFLDPKKINQISSEPVSLIEEIIRTWKSQNQIPLFILRSLFPRPSYCPPENPQIIHHVWWADSSLSHQTDPFEALPTIKGKRSEKGKYFINISLISVCVI